MPSSALLLRVGSLQCPHQDILAALRRCWTVVPGDCGHHPLIAPGGTGQGCPKPCVLAQRVERVADVVWTHRREPAEQPRRKVLQQHVGDAVPEPRTRLPGIVQERRDRYVGIVCGGGMVAEDRSVHRNGVDLVSGQQRLEKGVLRLAQVRPDQGAVVSG